MCCNKIFTVILLAILNFNILISDIQNVVQFAILEADDAISVRTVETPDDEELVELIASPDGLHIYFITERVVRCHAHCHP